MQRIVSRAERLFTRQSSSVPEEADSDGAQLASGELSASALGGLSSFERLGDRCEFSANIFEELPLCGFHFRFIAQG